MIEIIKKEDCCGCHACFQVCPKQAIQMKPDEEGFLYPIVDLSKCVNCGKCDKVCPEKEQDELSIETQIYAAYRKELVERLKSQSGGVFALLAEAVLRQNGVVFGAAFDEAWKLRHCAVENETDLFTLQRSKYVQSEIGTTFRQAKKFLDEGRKVLFSGTPCQIQGLKKYLGKKYDNLVTVDLICHGVPSPEVWKQYVKEIQGNFQLEEFIQKDKLRKNAIIYKLSDGTIRKETYEKNAYARGFSKNLFLRPSCHQCSFKGIERCSDITVGDFWGLEKFYPQFTDEYGISAVLVHTRNGQAAFDEIVGKMKMIHCDKTMLIPENPCMMGSSAVNVSRVVFFETWKKKGVIRTVNELTKLSTGEKLRLKLKKRFMYAVELGHAVKKHIYNK